MEIASFYVNAVLLLCQTTSIHYLISLIFVDLQIMLRLLYDHVNLVVKEDQLWAVGWAIKRKKVDNFGLQQLDCFAHTVHQCAVLLKV